MDHNDSSSYQIASGVQVRASDNWLQDAEPISQRRKLIADTSPQAVRNFWIGCAGLAILGQLVSAGLVTAVAFLDTYFRYLTWQLLGGQTVWAFTELHALTLSCFVTPSIVLIAINPVLLWREGLVLRTAIACSIALTSLAMIIGWLHSSYRIDKLPLLIPGLATSVACWLAIPIVLCWPKFRKFPLARCAVFAALTLLIVCVQLRLMVRFAFSTWVASWVTILVCGFAYSLAVRTWSSWATFESSGLEDKVERTSSRTLMELMVVCAVGITGSAAAASLVVTDWRWMSVSWSGIILMGGLTAITLTSFSTLWLRATLNDIHWPWLTRIGWFILLGICLGGIGWSDIMFSPRGRLSPMQLFVNAIVTALTASAVVVAFNWICGIWLKYCHWRML